MDTEGRTAEAQNDLRRSCLALVHELAEPLTAIGNYLQAIFRLDEVDTRSARAELRETLDKLQTQASRANEIQRRLRDLLR